MGYLSDLMDRNRGFARIEDNALLNASHDRNKLFGGRNDYEGDGSGYQTDNQSPAGGEHTPLRTLFEKYNSGQRTYSDPQENYLQQVKRAQELRNEITALHTSGYFQR